MITMRYAWKARTTLARLFSGWDILRRQRVSGHGWHCGAAVLFPPIRQRLVHECTKEKDAYAGVEREVGESAVVQKSGLVLRNAATDLGRWVHLRRRAPEGVEVVELRRRHGMANPVEELL